MSLGIKPTVDFAFKKILGTPENAPILQALINAILQLDSPIVELDILNPFSYQEFADDKRIVLDVRARDAEGRWLNVELAKYNLNEATISAAPAIAQWAFFLLRADRYEASRLRELLPGEAFQRAITAVETMAAKTEDRQMYDQREKALRDHQWMLESAREQGREQGREEGRQEGREKGLETGALIGKIQLLQQLLSEGPSAAADLRQQTLEELNSLLTDLQQRLRGRDKL